MNWFRTGIGYDVHPFAGPGEARPLVLGGVRIPHPRGLAGHSDADVLIHAICDAVLGALGLGDLGRRFPNTDPRYKGISSTELLESVAAMMRERGYKIENVDAVVIAEEPKIAPHVPAMSEIVAGALGARADQINIKGTRPEGLGALGRGEGIACHAVALLGYRGAIARLRAQVGRRRK